MSQLMTKSIKVSLLSWALPGLGHFVLNNWIPGAVFLAFSASMWWLVLMHYSEIRLWRLYHKEKTLAEERRRAESEEPDANPFHTESLSSEDAPKFPKIVFLFLLIDLGIRAFSARHAALCAGPQVPSEAPAAVHHWNKATTVTRSGEFSTRTSVNLSSSSSSTQIRTVSDSPSRSSESLVRSSEFLRSSNEEDVMPRSTNHLP